MDLLRVGFGLEGIHKRLGAPLSKLIPGKLEKAVTVGLTPDRIDLHLGLSIAYDLNAIHTRSRTCQLVA